MLTLYFIFGSYRLCKNLSERVHPTTATDKANNESQYSSEDGNKGRLRVVFLTDVAGVYDRAPRLPGAVLIKRINVQLDGTVKHAVHSKCLKLHSSIVFIFLVIIKC